MGPGTVAHYTACGTFLTTKHEVCLLSLWMKIKLSLKHLPSNASEQPANIKFEVKIETKTLKDIHEASLKACLLAITFNLSSPQYNKWFKQLSGPEFFSQNITFFYSAISF